MNITVNVDEISLDTVVADIVRYDSEDGEYRDGERTVADIVAEQITALLVKDDRWNSLRDRVLQIRKEVIREALLPVIEQAMGGAFQKTNTFGEPVGPEITMRQVIADEAKKMMTQPADSYNRDKGTVLQQMVRKEVEAALGAEIRDAVKQAREQVSGEIGSMVASAVQAGLKAR